MEVIVVSTSFVLSLALSLLLANATLRAICLGLRSRPGSVSLPTTGRLWNATRRPMPERQSSGRCGRPSIARNPSSSALASAGESIHCSTQDEAESGAFRSNRMATALLNQREEVRKQNVMIPAPPLTLTGNG